MSATGYLDACGFIPASSGTGDFVVASAMTGLQTPASAAAVNTTVYSYRAESADKSQWEEGFGAYTVSTTTLARTTVTANSLGTTAKISFSAAPNVQIVAASADLQNASLLTSGTLAAARLPFSASAITSSLSGDIALNITSTYFDGPSVAQGSSGTWWVCGTVTVEDTAGAAQIYAKLWDGTTVIASGDEFTPTASAPVTITLSGFIASPAGNLRISCRDITSTSGLIKANLSGNSKDSTISAFRIA